MCKMNAKELKEMLEFIPDTAKIYSYADHGQLAERSIDISVTNEANLEYYAEDIKWASVDKTDLEGGMIKYVDIEYIEEDDTYAEFYKTSEITAVLIG